MESIIVALITTVVAPLLIPIITSRDTLTRADIQDEELQEIANSLSMPEISELIEERRRRRVMRDALFRGARRMAILMLAYGAFFLGLSIYIFEGKRRSEGSELIGSWSLWIFLPLSAICIFISLYLLSYPSSMVKKLSRWGSQARDAQKIFKKAQKLADEASFMVDNIEAEQRLPTPAERGKIEGINQLFDDYEKVIDLLSSENPRFRSKWRKKR